MTPFVVQASLSVHSLLIFIPSVCEHWKLDPVPLCCWNRYSDFSVSLCKYNMRLRRDTTTFWTISHHWFTLASFWEIRIRSHLMIGLFDFECHSCSAGFVPSLIVAEGKQELINWHCLDHWRRRLCIPWFPDKCPTIVPIVGWSKDENGVLIGIRHWWREMFWIF